MSAAKEEALRRSALLINELDNVAVALSDIGAGDEVEIEGGVFPAISDIPCGHKVATVDIARGEPVLKYGEVIGRAAIGIRAGDWVHTQNLEAFDGD